MVQEERCQNGLKKIEEWLDSQAGRFQIFEIEDTSKAYFRRKATSEASLYFLFRHLSGEDIEGSALGQELTRMAEDPRLLRMAKRSIRDTWNLLLILVLGIKCNCATKGAEEHVHRFLAKPSTWGAEMPLYRKHELAIAAACLGQKLPNYETQMIVRQSIVANIPKAYEINGSEVYSITHHILMPVIFRIQNPNDFGWAVSKDMVTTMFGLCARSLATHDHDRLLEIVLAADILGAFPAALVDGLVERYLDIIERGDVIEMKMWKAARPFERASQDEQRWAHGYHTMLVMAFLLRWVQAEKGATQREGACCQLNMKLEDIEIFGLALEHLYQYDLEKACDLLFEALKFSDEWEVGALLEQVVEYIVEQRRDDGSFGEFTYEKIYFERTKGECFQKSVQNQIDKSCEKFLTAHKRGLYR